MAVEQDPPPPEPSKLTTAKQRWAAEGHRFANIRTGSDRLPPGQHLVQDWPVLDLGRQPTIAPEEWRLIIGGAVENSVVWDWATLQRQPQSERTSDIHCVTSWSRYDNDWKGVSTRNLLAIVRPTPDAAFVALHGLDGYTTNLTLEDFASDDALLAHSWQGQTLSRSHGGPVRLIVPHLYFWKSAKWIKRIDFRETDEPGFWEVNGYHNRGDPWAEQRYTRD
jgi:DMSO/TMAO reductase YedYZ molybdopterin-dependent catalytic subunit